MRFPDLNRWWQVLRAGLIACGAVASGLAADFVYTINSEPAGLVNQSNVAAAGTVISTPTVSTVSSGRRFAYWKVNGVRQAEADGAALPTARFVLNGTTTATAVYIGVNDDTDADGLPDWWEWQQFGSLDQTAVGDGDADGWSNAQEYFRGTSPLLADTISDGGVATGRSSKLVFKAVTPPTVTAQSAATQVGSGTSVTLTVTSTDVERDIYQWKKDGVAIAGATNATYTIATATTAEAGVYSVVVANVAGTVTSAPMPVAVVPAGTEAAQAVASVVYNPGGTVTVTNTITYGGTAAALDWQVLLPAGWSFAGDTGTAGANRPAPGATGLLHWEWTTVPASPVVFSYTVNVPQGETLPRELAALANLQLTGPALKLLARPDPLILRPSASIHTADTDGNGRIELRELTRVIELYNTRHGSVRTGYYRVQAGTEDGFASDPTRTGETAATLGRYHSGDTHGAATGTAIDAAIDLAELTRVIELYNFRAGVIRTGQYHAQPGTEDGFAPGP